MLFKLLRLLKYISNKKLKKDIILSQALIALASFLEVLTFIMLVPIISNLTGDESKLKLIENILKENMGISLENYFFYAYLSLYILLVITSTLIGIYSIIKLSRLVSELGVLISKSLLYSYLNSPYKTFILNPVAYYNNFLTSEVQRLQDNILQPIVQINSRFFAGILILGALFVIEPFISLISFILFAIFYLAIYLYLKSRLYNYGKSLSHTSHLKLSAQKDALSLYRETKIYSAQKFFLELYSNSANSYAKSYSSLNILYNVPRYLVDGFVYLLFALMVIYSTLAIESNNSTLTIIFIFGMAAVKLLPILQTIYSSLARIKGSISVIESINSEFSTWDKKHDNEKTLVNDDFDSISLKNITYIYPNSSSKVLRKININLPATGKIAIIGRSGSGKTTLVDVLTGLLEPSSGELLLNSGKNQIPISDSNISIGYVSQQPKLLYGSLKINIAFGVILDEIDVNRVRRCLYEVGLLDLVDGFDDGIETILSSDGYGLSGGQLQRISIARALYHDSRMIIFDEPTSALDKKSEKQISKLLQDLSRTKLIVIIAHRLETIHDASIVYLLSSGKIVAEGIYSDISNTQEFIDYSSHTDSDSLTL